MKGIKLFNGHVDVFNSYYRHLYRIVKNVSNFKYHSNEEKKQYLGILRSQLSSKEQTLLYYNWKSGKGRTWEQSDGNHFFSKYLMIHNIIPEDCIVDSLKRREDTIGRIGALSENDIKNLFEKLY